MFELYNTLTWIDKSVNGVRKSRPEAQSLTIPKPTINIKANDIGE
jgi:hypothetical protein